MVSCVVDGDELVIRVSNDSDTVLDYWISLVVYADGARSTDTTAFFSSVPPGVTADERLTLFDEPGDACEAVSADGYEPFGDEATESEATCEVTGADSFDDVEGVYTVTNNDGTRRDIQMVLGFYDADGTRQGTTVEFADGVDPGASVSNEYITFVDYDPAYTCRVDSIDASDS